MKVVICPRCGGETEKLADKRYNCTNDDCTLFSFRRNRRGEVYDVRDSGPMWIQVEKPNNMGSAYRGAGSKVWRENKVSSIER